MNTYMVRLSVEGVYEETEIDAATPGAAAFEVGMACGKDGYGPGEIVLHGIDQQSNSRGKAPDTRAHPDLSDLPRDACADCGRVLRYCECNGVATDLD